MTADNERRAHVKAKFDMSGEPSTTDWNPNCMERPSYQRPRLRLYGRVAQLTQGTGTVGSDGGQTMTMNPQSDRRLKTNIVRVGEHRLGIGLYLFDFKPEFRDRWGSARQFGVMADEVEAVLPEAVSVHADGYKIVDYGRLGIERYPS